MTKAQLERELEIQKALAAAARAELRAQWLVEQEAQSVRDANDILTIELEKERSQGKTLVAERIVNVPVPVLDRWHRRVNIVLCIAVTVLLALLLGGCASFEPEGATPFAPPASYRAVWTEAQACTGRRRDFNQLRFWWVPGESFEREGRPLAGYADRPNIYLAEIYRDHPMVVKHEMIHVLGVGGGHPPVFEQCKATWATWDRTTPRLAL
jgi:hypothetical protein